MEPARRASATTPIELHHPSPSVDSLSRSPSRDYVNKLEQSAEEMSQGGSDIGEEIRRMNEAEKERSRTRSRQSSLQKSPVDMQDGERASDWDRVSRSRNASTSSYANSVAEARWGGYSPGGFLTSPTGSVHSSSGTRASAMNRAASGSKPSRLTQMIEPVQEGRPLDSPLAPTISNSSIQDSRLGEEEHDTRPETDDNNTLYAAEGVSRQISHATQASRASQISFGRRYDQLASEIEGQLGKTALLGEDMHHEETLQEEREEERPGTVTPPDRSRSVDTFQQAELAFKDFDGVHFSPETEELVQTDEDGREVRRVSARTSSGNLSIGSASMLRAPQPQRPITYAAPPPGENMTYYPAPVPRMLNLPKRLSQLPAAGVHAKRRTHALSQLDPFARASAPWLSQTDLSASSGGRHSRDRSNSPDIPHKTPAERERMLGRQNLPPQLRASVFFDHQPIPHDVEVTGESAVATLDSILQASVNAPVNAFADHPFAGDVRRDAFAPEHKARRSTTTLAIPAETDPKLKKRRSSISNLLKRNSSADELTTQLSKKGSSNSLLMSLVDGNAGGKKLQKRHSQMSLGTDLDVQGSQPKTPGEERDEPELQDGLIAGAQNAAPASPNEQDPASASRSATATSRQLAEGDQIRQDFEEAEKEEDVDDGEQLFVQPSTLLAELQVRKAKQKSRNRTAANSFPNGMHSTLLQLDAVEEISRTRRKREKIRLAWEDPQQAGLKDHDDDQDDNVPLGVLYPSKTGLINQIKGDGRDWQRPLGLMARRELEDNEPLSKRRDRLQGRPAEPQRRLPTWLPTSSQMHISGQPDAQDAAAEANAESDEERVGETLGDRMKRLRDRQALDATIAGVADEESKRNGSRPVSSWTDEILSQFGGLNNVKDEDKQGDDQAKTKSRPGSSGGALNVAAKPLPTTPGAEVDPEEETLAQMRARLKRERETNGSRNVSGESNTNIGQTLSRNSSMANLLAAHPVGPQDKPKTHQHSAPPGTLLHASEQSQAKARRSLIKNNTRASSYSLNKPLVDVPTQGKNAHMMSGGLLGGQNNSMNVSGGFGGGVWNNGLGGVGGRQTPTSTPNYTAVANNGGGSGYFAPATKPLGYNYSQSPMVGYGQQQQQQYQVGNPVAYQALTGATTPYGFPQQMQMIGGAYGYGAQGMGMGMGMGMPVGYGMQMEEPLKPQQRDMIDRWRMSVAP